MRKFWWWRWIFKRKMKHYILIKNVKGIRMHNRPTVQTNKKQRKCLRCLIKFLSSRAGNRICKKCSCKKTDQDHDYSGFEGIGWSNNVKYKYLK